MLIPFKPFRDNSIRRASTVSARSIDIVPAIREGGPHDGRAPAAQDADGFAAERPVVAVARWQSERLPEY